MSEHMQVVRLVRGVKNMILKITKKEWIIAWIEKKLGIISPSACANGYKYRYDWFKAMAEGSRR